MPLLSVLRNRVRPPREAEDAPLAPELEPMPGPEVEFSGYAEDCRVFGFMRLDAARMTDALNQATEYHLKDVMVQRLENGLATQVNEMDVPREELLAARAAGPRGDVERRSRRRPYPVTLKTGPYLIHGYVHSVPGGDPLLEVRRRKPMVPLTESWIEYVAGTRQHRARTGTIIVNRELWDWIRMSKDEEVRLPDLPAEAAIDARAKDMTGWVRQNGE